MERGKGRISDGGSSGAKAKNKRLQAPVGTTWRFKLEEVGGEITINKFYCL